ncbi:hypothetical protein ACIA8K_12650 [Catenuloplanes sp. NPDC051500]|uniref:hypothetical protein n=1 Tax=Catenuloplanes sp. NPDC051500 TaxID=3363959 RepID=UPI0037A74284
MANLPPIVRQLAELSPVEDILLHVLRERLPGVRVQALVHDDQHWPLVLVRRLPQFGDWQGDDRFTDRADIAVHTFCEDPDGDEDAALLAEAVRVSLRNAWFDNAIVPGRGHITRVQMTSAPRRAPDWATSSGPVQYADLPTGVTRYETQFRVSIRKALTPNL